MNKNKNNLWLAFSFLFLFLLAGIFVFSFHSCHAGPYDYTTLEPIPGTGNTGADLKAYLEAIYKFAIWTVGIAAILMLTIGGFMYMVSAGNTSKAETAKKVITDAILGLVIVLGAYLILYVINPDLVNITITMKPLSGTTGTGTGTGGASGGGTSGGTGSGSGNGTCQEVPSGPCSVSNLKSTCLSGNASVFSSICNIESRGNTSIASGTDKCKDGYSFSIGLFQINMITSAGSISGCNGKSIFKTYGSGPQGTCLDRKGSLCYKWDCEVIDKSAYDSCRSKLTNPDTNISIACNLSNNGNKLGPWAFTKNKCGF
jgi:hypothetical protein